MGLFSSLFGKGKDSKTVTNKIQNNSTPKGGEINFLLADEFEKRIGLACAKSKDGVICLGTKSEGVIGRYEKDDKGGFKVLSESGNWIGSIDVQNRKIYLTAAADYEYFKKMNPYVKEPVSFYWYAADIYPNGINDGETNELVATVDGNPFEAAAAFVCLVYEEMSSGNRYGAYFHSWKK